MTLTPAPASAPTPGALVTPKAHASATPYALGYVAMFRGRRVELYAKDLADARAAAEAHFPVPRTKAGLLTVMLAEQNATPVTHAAHV